MLVRIIDIGSNSVKATLYEIEGGKHKIEDRDKLDYALGDAVFSDGSIPESGTEKVADFIREACGSKGEKAHFTFAVATSAVRSAKNREAFLKRVEQKGGHAVRVLSGAEESYLIHTGISTAAGIKDEGVFKTIDIGGGSAEVSWSRGGKYLFGRSYELGAIRLSSRFLKTSSFNWDEFDRIYEHAQEELKRHTPEMAPPADRAIGSSGNMRAIAKMAGAMRGPTFTKTIPELTPGTLEDLCESVLGRTPSQLASMFDLPLKRARIVMPAVLVLLACLRSFGIRRLEISEAGLREGVAEFWSRNGHLNLPVADEDSTHEKSARR